MRFFNSSLPGNHEELSVSVKDEVDVFGSKSDDGSVVKNDVRKERICCLVRVFYSRLVELQFGHSKSTNHH